jgi:DNA-binding response OmpR family regulator
VPAVPRTILVTNDEAQLAATLSDVGKQHGISVVLIPRARLVARARADQPALVVLLVSSADGLETLSLLKNSPKTRDIPVVVIADVDEPEMRELALDVGAAGFISRPLGPDLGAKLLALMG